jgi:hypothetical protein
MVSEYLQILTSRDTLLAAGVCLIFFGIVMRGLVRSNSRAMALRKQHELHLRKRGEESRAGNVAKETEHLEKYLPRYAAGCISIGLILIVAALLR